MPSSLPPSVRESWGEQVADDFSQWLDQTLQERTVHRDERPDQGDPTDRQGGSTRGVYRVVLSRLDVLEERLEQMEVRFDERFDQIDQRFEQIDQRFEQIDQRFESMEERFNERFENMEKRFDERFENMRSQFDERFDGMRTHVDDRFEGMGAKLDRMNDRILSMTRWLIGLVALFGTLVTVLLAVAQFGS